jgi:hypothetical protein
MTRPHTQPDDDPAEEIPIMQTRLQRPTRRVGVATERKERRESLAEPRLTVHDMAFVGLWALLVVGHVVAALLAWGWITAVLLDVLAGGYLLCLAARLPWRPLVVRLLLLGLVAGMLELATDAAGRDFAHSLVYPPGAPLLWASPIYMPFSWMIVLTQLGYLGWRLRALAPRVSPPLAVALTGLAGALMIPFYEESAYYAGWWHYIPTRLALGHTPAYVFLFEGLVAAALPLVTAGLTWRPLGRVALRGVAVGTWLSLAALVAWLTLGR